jgi:hypothetical protein
MLAEMSCPEMLDVQSNASTSKQNHLEKLFMGLSVFCLTCVVVAGQRKSGKAPFRRQGLATHKEACSAGTNGIDDYLGFLSVHWCSLE